MKKVEIAIETDPDTAMNATVKGIELVLSHVVEISHANQLVNKPKTSENVLRTPELTT